MTRQGNTKHLKAANVLAYNNTKEKGPTGFAYVQLQW